MLTSVQIAQLNSNDISDNAQLTKTVVTQLWNSASSHQKQQAVILGSYSNTKSFSPVKGIGKISVRMAVTLAQVFNVNPFYIIGNITQDTGFNDNILNEFLQNYGFGDFVSDTAPSSPTPTIRSNPITKEMLKELANNIIDNVEMTEELAALSEEEIIQLITALNTQARLNNLNATIKLSLIKRILAY